MGSVSSAADIVQPSVAATGLPGVDEMFGIPDGSNAGTNSILTNLEDLATGSTGTAAAATVAHGQSAASPAEQLDNCQCRLQEALLVAARLDPVQERFAEIRSVMASYSNRRETGLWKCV